MTQRIKNMRELLVQAGIEEINAHGVTGFSIRRVAQSCGVSCAAPYKHFKDKHEFIIAVIEYVNGQWALRQKEVLAACGESFRQQIVEISVAYVRFLMENPYFRPILMLKDAGFDNIYHKPQGQMSSRTQQIERDFFATTGWEDSVKKRKLHVVRAMIFGTIFMFETGELEYCDEVLENIRYNIDREFDLA